MSNTIKGADAPSEIEREFNHLEQAKSRLYAALAEFSERLDRAGVLGTPRPEIADSGEAENIPDSPMGHKIRGIRCDLSSIADDFSRLLDRLAI